MAVNKRKITLPPVCRFTTLSECRQHYPQISQGKDIRFPFMWPLHLRVYIRIVSGFCFMCNITLVNPPFMQFLFLPKRLPPASFGFPSRWTPLPLVNAPYCKAYSGLSPYSLYPCLTHILKRTCLLFSFVTHPTAAGSE